RAADFPLPAHAAGTLHRRPAESGAVRRPAAATAVAVGFHATFCAWPTCADPCARSRALPAPRQLLEPRGLLSAPVVLVQPAAASGLAQVPPRPGNVLRRAGAAARGKGRGNAVRKDAH